MLRLLIACFQSLYRPLPKPRDEEQGFTLVELMVVIVIIGLLATVVLVNVLPSQDRAMTTKARADIATLEQAMEMYRLDNFTYPADLAALVSPPPGADASRFRSGSGCTCTSCADTLGAWTRSSIAWGSGCGRIAQRSSDGWHPG